MADYTGFVRPFQIPDYTPPRLPQPSGPPAAASDNLILRIGAGTKGSYKVEHISYSISVTNYMVKQNREVGDTTGIGEFSFT